jgi:hypothetical protein
MDFTLEEYEETSENKEDARRTVHVIVQLQFNFVNMTTSVF